MQIIFVCTGNTCRSPMAEGILKSLQNDYEVLSRGLYVPEEIGASFFSIKAMEEMDIDISKHKSKQLTVGEAEDCDLIITMTKSHKDIIVSAYPKFSDKTFTLSEYAGEEGDIRDPYGMDENAYRECAKQIRRLMVKADFEKTERL